MDDWTKRVDHWMDHRTKWVNGRPAIVCLQYLFNATIHRQTRVCPTAYTTTALYTPPPPHLHSVLVRDPCLDRVRHHHRIYIVYWCATNVLTVYATTVEHRRECAPHNLRRRLSCCVERANTHDE